MYGGFGGRDFTRWLMYGTRTAICRVQAVELQRLYSRYPDLGAIHKPLSVPRTPESAIYKRVIHPRALKASQGRPDSAHHPRIRKIPPVPVRFRYEFAPTSSKSDKFSPFLSENGDESTVLDHPIPPHLPQNQTESARSCLKMGVSLPLFLYFLPAKPAPAFLGIGQNWPVPV